MDITFMNFLDLMAYFGPYLLILIFSVLGFIGNTPMKSVIYVSMLLLSTSLILFFQQFVFKEDNFNKRDPLCDLWKIPYINNAFNTPSISTYVIIFTLMYALVPMIISGETNVFILMLLITVLGIDVMFKSAKRCLTTLSGIVSTILGLILGGGIAIAFTLATPQLMYFTNTVSNKTSCSRVSKKKFKCSVYKNGKLIQTL